MYLGPLGPLRAPTEPDLDVSHSVTRVLESLDRVCPACLAAREMFEWEMLHQGHPRPLRCRRPAATPVQVMEVVTVF